jgi:uncharacterized phage-associated protein
MTYDARAISNLLLDRGAVIGCPVTIMSLLKILYFAHAWHLAKTDEPLVGQPFEAWKYGPVNRVVYEQFKGLGSKPIETRAKVINVDTAIFETAKYDDVDVETSRFLGNIFDFYSQYHPYKLSDLTHEEGSPWEMVWTEATRKAVPGMVISNESIRSWFRTSRIAQRGADGAGWTT